MRMNHPVVSRLLRGQSGTQLRWRVLSLLVSLLFIDPVLALDPSKFQLPEDRWGQLVILNSSKDADDAIELHYLLCSTRESRMTYQPAERKELCLAEKTVTIPAGGMIEVSVRDQIQAMRDKKPQDDDIIYYVRITGLEGKGFTTIEKGGQGVLFRDLFCERRLPIWHRGWRELRPHVLDLSVFRDKKVVVCRDCSPNINSGLENPYFNKKIPAPQTVIEKE
ncbi:hypothetical protein ACWJJH_06820 [Endozoicomonadaceae bacterium StTr2]